MKKILLSTVFLLILSSCSSRKQIEKAISHGNYDQAINKALQKLDSNKDKSRKQDFVVLLKDAYNKVLAEDLRDIKLLKKDGNAEQYRTIYNLYTDLEARQDAIKRVLPLKINGETLDLNFNDYTSEIVSYRYKTSDYLIDKGIALLDSEDKYKAREAYEVFSYIESINPNFEETRVLMEEAHLKGTDYVLVSIKNQTRQIIPQELEADLLNFDTYGLNHFWTVYHANSSEEINYDYAMQLELKQIAISPEQINQKELLREKNIIDGWEYKTDRRGNIILDSLGNKIKIDKVVNVKARYLEVSQFKSAEVFADVVYTDLKSNQNLDSFPIESVFIFEHFYGTYRGDHRALNRDEFNLTRSRPLIFPTDEQMVYDSGEDLKMKLKDIISAYQIRKS